MENDDTEEAGEAGDIAADVKCLTSLLTLGGWLYVYPTAGEGVATATSPLRASALLKKRKENILDSCHC